MRAHKDDQRPPVQQYVGEGHTCTDCNNMHADFNAMLEDNTVLCADCLRDEIDGLEVEHLPKSLEFQQDKTTGRQYRLHAFKARAFLRGNRFPFESYGQGETINQAERAARRNVLRVVSGFLVGACTHNNKHEDQPTPPKQQQNAQPDTTPKAAPTPKQDDHPAIATREDHHPTVELPKNPRGYFFATAKDKGFTAPGVQRLFLAVESREHATDKRYSDCANFLQHCTQQDINQLIEFLQSKNMKEAAEKWRGLPPRFKEDNSPLLESKDYLKGVLPNE